MIPDDARLERGMIVRHDPEGGLVYGINAVGLDTDDYEDTHAIKGSSRVAYTQLEDGDYPAGSHWDKDEAQFRANFTILEGKALASFLVQDYLRSKNE